MDDPHGKLGWWISKDDPIRKLSANDLRWYMLGRSHATVMMLLAIFFGLMLGLLFVLLIWGL